MTRTQRTYVVAAAVAAIVTAANASQGAYFSQSWGWVALAFLVPSTVLLILDRVEAPGRLRIAFATLMVALAAWVALSSFWSISSPASIREVERALVYVAVALAVVLVLRRGDGPAVVAGASLGILLIVSYGLTTHLAPDHFGPPDDRFNTSRLAAPLGYWNSFGLLAAIGVLLVLGAAAHARRCRHAVPAAGVLPLLVVALYFTFSRGSWVALVLGVGATLVLDPRRLRLIWTLLLIAPASCIAVAIAWQQDALTTEDAPLTLGVTQGRRLAWILALLVVLSAALGWFAYRVADRVHITSRVRRIVNVALAIAALSGVVIGLFAAVRTDAVSDLRRRFDTETRGAVLNDRLFSVAGNGRSETISVAWDMAARHPVVGTGAGTFEYVWYRERPSRQVVRDAHSLYVETLGELGVVGALLLIALLLVPVAGGVLARRSRFIAPATGAYLAWVTAAALDWHWEMVGVTTTAFVAGSAGLLATERGQRRPLSPSVRKGLLAAGVVLSVVATWSLVGNQALFAGRDAIARKDWREARSDARRARALLFWSHEPDFAFADAAAGLGDREATLRAYRDAVDKDPNNWIAWIRLARVARGAERDAAYHRVRELNPLVEGVPVR
jgi:O-antigen ligase/polysaccharide polymerase Wzy-like membrane protein